MKGEKKRDIKEVAREARREGVIGRDGKRGDKREIEQLSDDARQRQLHRKASLLRTGVILISYIP